jgi:hypothetical protein
VCVGTGECARPTFIDVASVREPPASNEIDRGGVFTGCAK